MTTQAYWTWDAAGRPWRLAQPIKELYALAGAAGVGRLGTLGSDDENHLKNDFPQDHTPFSETAWPDPLPGYVVCACDIADGPWMDRMLADARAGLLPWLKYLNFRGMQFSRKTGWAQRSSSDRHGHISGMSNHTWTTLGGWNPFTGQQGEDMAFDDLDKKRIASAEFRLHHLFQLDSTVGDDPFGGTYNLKLVTWLQELRDEVEGIRDAVAVLESGGVTEAMLERVMRKILGESDGAVPPA